MAFLIECPGPGLLCLPWTKAGLVALDRPGFMEALYRPGFVEARVGEWPLAALGLLRQFHPDLPADVCSLAVSGARGGTL